MAPTPGVAISMNDIHQFCVLWIQPRGRGQIEAMKRIGDVVEEKRTSWVHSADPVENLVVFAFC